MVKTAVQNCLECKKQTELEVGFINVRKIILLPKLMELKNFFLPSSG
jgi:hypothetical protein